MLYTQPVAGLSGLYSGTKMDTPSSTQPIVLISIMAIWVFLSLFMGAKKAYFDTWDKIPEDEPEKHA